MWAVAAGLGLLSVVTGLLSPHDALDTIRGLAPVLGFLVAVTVLAELSDAAQVFDIAAARAARLGGGSTRRLYVLVVLLGALTTVVLSLDTTAVLLTPVVLALAQTLELSPLPFALAAVWLANTASLLLPVSNLTNLLAVRRLGLSTLGYAGRMLLPEVLAVAASLLVLLVWHRRDLRGRYVDPPPIVPTDRVLVRVAAGACLAVGPFFVAGLPVWAVAGVAAAVVTGFFAVRRRSALRFTLVPWRLVLLVTGLFLVVAALGPHGLDAGLRTLAGTGSGATTVARTAGVAAVGSNLVNNLPAYSALEHAVPAGHRDQLLGLLLGVDVGPLVLVFGSLATLLWRERCRARGVEVSAWQFARLGLVGMPLVLVVTVAGLLVTG